MVVQYERPVAHIKHVGGFAQRYYREQATRRGDDAALLSTADGVVAETAIANIGFLRGSSVGWPATPALYGTTRQLLTSGCPDAARPRNGKP